MAIDPFFGAIAGAGITSAAQIGGGFLSRPDHSERDLMWEQRKLHERGLVMDPSFMMTGLRNAGVNPMLPFAKGPPQVAPMGGIPTRMEDPLGAAVGRAGASAAQAARAFLEFDRMQAETDNIKETNRKIRAEINNIAANTDLVTAKSTTEKLQPSVIEIGNELNSAKTDRERQQLQKDIIETAIRKEELSVAEKDAIVAAIDIDMYSSTVGEVSRWMEKLGIEPRAAVGIAHMLWSYMRTKRSK